MPFGWHQAHFGVPSSLGLVFLFNLHTQLLLVKTDQRGTSLFLQVYSAILSLKSNENTQEFLQSYMCNINTTRVGLLYGFLLCLYITILVFYN